MSGTNTKPSEPRQMPDIIIENSSQYQELRDEDPTQADIEQQQKIMDLIKKINFII